MKIEKDVEIQKLCYPVFECNNLLDCSQLTVCRLLNRCLPFDPCEKVFIQLQCTPEYFLPCGLIFELDQAQHIGICAAKLDKLCAGGFKCDLPQCRLATEIVPEQFDPGELINRINELDITVKELQMKIK